MSTTEPPVSVVLGVRDTEPPVSVVLGVRGTEPPVSVVLGVRGTEPTVSVVLGITAALSLLAAVMAAYRKYRSSRVRVHAALQAPSAVLLHSAQSVSKHC